MSAGPPLLLPYQQRWIADRSKVKIAEKSRRIGWSWATAAELTLDAACADGCDGWYVGYNRDMTEGFIRDSADWARAFDVAASEIEEQVLRDGDKDILAFCIRFASGFRVTALSSRPSNLRGKQGHAVLDEAAFHDDLPGLLKSALAFLMWGGRVSVISTHNGTDSAFAKLVEEVRSGKKPYSIHRCTLDDALAEGLFRRICLSQGIEWNPEAEAAWREELFAYYGEDADEELRCIPARSGGVYLSRALVEARMYEAPVLRFTPPVGFLQWTEDQRKAEMSGWLTANVLHLVAMLPRESLHVLGEDFGRKGDLTVLAPATITTRLIRRVPFAVELRDTPYMQQWQAFEFLASRLPRFVRAAVDAGGNGGFIAEQATLRFGESVVESVQLSEGWYRENLPPFRAAFEDRLLELPRDADHVSDCAAFRMIDGCPKLPHVRERDTKDGGYRHGDAGIAYALMHYASRLDFPSYAYNPVRLSEERLSARPVRTTAGLRLTKGLI